MPSFRHRGAAVRATHGKTPVKDTWILGNYGK